MKKKAPELNVIRRVAFVPELRSVNTKDRTIEFAASTEAVDRYGDIIRVDGWDTAAYEKNPVFLWAHDSRSMPIGKTISLSIEKKPKPALVHIVQFPTADVSPEGAQVFSLYQNGYLNAVSVGFRPTVRPKPILDENDNFTGWEFVGQELLELSAVPIPANPEAVARCLKSGIITAETVDMFFITEKAKKTDGEEHNPEEKSMESKLKEVIGRIVETKKDIDERLTQFMKSDDMQEMKSGISAAISEQNELFASVVRSTTEEISKKLESVYDAIEAFSRRMDKAEKILSGVALNSTMSELSERVEEATKKADRNIAPLVRKQEVDDLAVRVKAARDAQNQGFSATAKATDVETLVSSHRELAERFEVLRSSVASAAELKEIGSQFDALRESVSGLAKSDSNRPLEDKVSEIEKSISNLAESFSRFVSDFRSSQQIDKMVCPYTDDPIAAKGTVWDAGAEMAKQATPTGWKHMSTVIVGDATNKTSYKLPHHQGSGFKVVPDGVRAALGRLEQTQMAAADRAGARSHLTRHQAKISAQAGYEFDQEAFERKLAELGCVLRSSEADGDKEGMKFIEEKIEAHIASVIPKEKPVEGEKVDPLKGLFIKA